METFNHIKQTDVELDHRYSHLQSHMDIVKYSEERRAQVVREMTHIAFEQIERLKQQSDAAWEELAA